MQAGDCPGGDAGAGENRRRAQHAPPLDSAGVAASLRIPFGGPGELVRELRQGEHALEDDPSADRQDPRAVEVLGDDLGGASWRAGVDDGVANLGERLGVPLAAKDLHDSPDQLQRHPFAQPQHHLHLDQVPEAPQPDMTPTARNVDLSRDDPTVEPIRELATRHPGDPNDLLGGERTSIVKRRCHR